MNTSSNSQLIIMSTQPPPLSHSLAQYAKSNCTRTNPAKKPFSTETITSSSFLLPPPSLPLVFSFPLPSFNN